MGKFHAEFVVAAADVLDECVSGADHAGRAEPFEATHWPKSGLEASMIGLDGIIPVLLHNMAHGRQQLIEQPRISRCPVGAHLAWARAVLKSSGEEPAGGRPVPLLRHQHINDLPKLVDRPVEVDPPAGNLDICFIDEPSIPGSVPTGACCINQQRGLPLHPAVDGDVINHDATFGQ